MAAIVSEKFHVHNARQFVESLSETANDTYYLFIGRSTPSPAGDGSPTTPEDSVANTTFSFWDDMVAARRIKPTDVVYLAPRYNWTANTQYAMYDSRVDQTAALANTSHPFYVLTSNYDVFKCIYNGRTNSASGAANSTVEPSISGQADITALTSASGNPVGYVWKYLYTLPTADALRYLTNSFIPVTASFDTLDGGTGDVYDDGSNQFDVFNASRAANGAILRILVETQGAGYDGSPVTVTITGDGTSAAATATVAAGKVTAINMSVVGSDYSYANVAISGGGASTNATATAIISPRSPWSNSTGLYYTSSHPINLPEELSAKYVMLYVELVGNGESLIAVGNDYRRIGIVRNPQLYGTNTVATANVYSQTLDLSVSGAGSFTKDEIVWQASSNARGVLIEVEGSIMKLTNVRGTFNPAGGQLLGVGNGNTTAVQAAAGGVGITSLPDEFPSAAVANSGATATLTSVAFQDLKLYSGTILYADHRAPITRAADQTEVIRTILSF